MSSIRAVISEVHENVHAGKTFTGYHNDASLDNGSSIDIYLQTPAIAGLCPHLIFDIHGSEHFEFFVYENPTVTIDTGTHRASVNKNFQSGIVSSISSNEATPTAGSYTIDPSVVSVGTQKLYDSITTGHKQGGTVHSEREAILAPSSSYLFRITSGAAGNAAYMGLDWYEPAAG